MSQEGDTCPPCLHGVHRHMDFVNTGDFTRLTSFAEKADFIDCKVETPNGQCVCPAWARWYEANL